MKYVSIDIETTGLDPAGCQTLEVAVVVDDLADPKPLDELARLRLIILHRSVTGDPFALSMHQALLKEIADAKGTPYSHELKPGRWAMASLPGTAPGDLANWIEAATRSAKVVVAGKNFAGFDRPFLAALGMPVSKLFHHRVLDPAGDWIQAGDTVPPDLSTCLARAGLPAAVSHRAMDDALQVVQLLRAGLGTRIRPNVLVSEPELRDMTSLVVNFFRNDQDLEIVRGIASLASPSVAAAVAARASAILGATDAYRFESLLSRVAATRGGRP